MITRYLKYLFGILSILFLFFCFIIPTLAAVNKNSCATNTVFRIGAGIYDITGPAAEEGMMGYGMINQKTAGLYQRLWARAFVIESPCNHKRIIFVNADLGQVFQGIKQQVVLKLKEKYGNLYSDDNVMLTATHQHSGPGGYSTYTLYNLSTLGFSRENFDTIINGILNAIDRAQNNMRDATIKIAKGELKGISFNRSPSSYLLNPKNERERYAENTDTEMTLLRFDTLDGKPIGLINWFAIHGVSMNNKNHLINGDNKGYAAYLFEKDFQSDDGPTDFVAAFAQSNAGDVSPNPYGKEGGTGLEGLVDVEKAGHPQYEKAKELFANANELVRGEIEYRHTYVAMDAMTIDPQFTDGKTHTTCPAAIGISMLAGTQDGEGVGVQGATCDILKSTLPELVCDTLQTICQGVKPIVLETGTKKPYPWTPNILPFQVFKIGQLVIAAAPFELTTMVGRRLRETISTRLESSDLYHIVLSPLANAYAQYVTTHEEYELQRYEGASTLFGPWEAAAIQQIFAQLTTALVNNKPVLPGPTPPDLSGVQMTIQTGVLFDDKPIGKSFGDISVDVKPLYHPGETAEVTFWGAHPKNDYNKVPTFLEVQQWLPNGEWHTIRKDRDWDTEYQWERYWTSYSLVTLRWRIPQDIPHGIYRFVHQGKWKTFWGGYIYDYTGNSSPFIVG